MQSHSPSPTCLTAALLLIPLTLMTSCAGGSDQPLETQTGLAAFYRGRSSGETLNGDDLVAAHPSYPRDTRVRVTNLENNKSVEVRINDKGPAAEKRKEGVIIDLSRAAAEELGMVSEGVVKVRVEVLEWGNFKRVTGQKRAGLELRCVVYS